MDPQQMMAQFYPPGYAADAGYVPFTCNGPMGTWGPLSAQMMGYPSTPTTSGMHMMPDTTVKSGSEFGDTPPSSGSSSNQTKRKFKSPEEEKRYRQKRTRNNEAAKKSRKSRKDKEVSLQNENTGLKEQLRLVASQMSAQQQEIANLKAQLAAAHEAMRASNSENIDPAAQFSQFTQDSKPFQGMMYPLNINSQ